MKNNSGLYVELNKCYLKENNEQIKEIVNRYADKARLGKGTLVNFCISMFCGGAKYQKSVIDAEMEMWISREIIGNYFIATLDNAIKVADVVCFDFDFEILLEIAKESYNAGINYAYDVFHDVVNEVYGVQKFIL